jgi:argininosuccinate synthase
VIWLDSAREDARPTKTKRLSFPLCVPGGFGTSVLLSWLKETYDAEMIAFRARIGQTEKI